MRHGSSSFDGDAYDRPLAINVAVASEPGEKYSTCLAVSGRQTAAATPSGAGSCSSEARLGGSPSVAENRMDSYLTFGVVLHQSAGY
eukprot:1608998-Pyramimonas_sp.AAC.1